MDPVPTASRQTMLDGARKLADHAIELASQSNVRISIVVSDAGGDVVTLDRMDGASPMGVDIAAATAAAAVNFGMASAEIQSQRHYADGALESLMVLVPYRMLALPGGYPMSAGGRVVGAIGIYCSELDRAHEIAENVARLGVSQFAGVFS